jgi:hypothetical protein
MLVYLEQSASGVQVEIFGSEEEDKDYEIRNHRCKVQKMKNRWKILRSTQY